MPGTCSECGNIHYGPCATEETYFVWEPNQKELPKEVLICGSWKKWQTFDRLIRQVRENGEVFFRVSLTLSAGTYHYKFIVDGNWLIDPLGPTTEDEHGCLNNTLKVTQLEARQQFRDEGAKSVISGKHEANQVYPKKMFLPVSNEGTIKITSNLLIEGLKLVGSWDNWAGQIPMARITNQLLGREEQVAFVPNIEPNREYQFKFKLKKQFLIDEKYPTTLNEFNTQNNVIIAQPTYEEGSNQESAKKERTATPNITLSAHPKNVKKDFSCKSFEWMAVSRSFDLPYRRVEGHSMAAIGDFLYIFGGNDAEKQVTLRQIRYLLQDVGYCRSQFYNSLTKLSIQLNSAKTEEALPSGRAFHNFVTYGNKILLYGGHNSAIQQNYYSFNVSEEKWMAVPHISGNFPEKVEKQSCVLYEMLMVFFGGYYCSHDFEYEACYNSISVLDIQNMRWVDHIQVLGQKPLGRFAHTAALMDSDMYIFGGIHNPAENIYLNDIWRINLSKGNQLTWVELNPKGRKPCARHGHTMNPLHNYLVVFGGHSQKGTFLNDVFIYNTVEDEWFEPMITGDVPRPRFYHAAATVVQHEEIVVFGGRTDKQTKIQNLYVLRPNQKISALNISEQDNDE